LNWVKRFITKGPGSEIVRFVLKADNKFEKNQWAGISLTTVTEHWTNCVRNKWKIHVIYFICVKNQLPVELRADNVQPILHVVPVCYIVYRIRICVYYVSVYNHLANKILFFRFEFGILPAINHIS